MTIYILLKNTEENEILYEYLKQNNYRGLEGSLLKRYKNQIVSCIGVESKDYFCSWSNSEILDSLDKRKTVTLRQFILRQEGRILL